MRTPQRSRLPEATAARGRGRTVKRTFGSARNLGELGRVLGLSLIGGGLHHTACCQDGYGAWARRPALRSAHSVSSTVKFSSVDL